MTHPSDCEAHLKYLSKCCHALFLTYLQFCILTQT